jgi:ADP-ribose pyrophosphatase YjhB (NUDIX family)
VRAQVVLLSGDRILLAQHERDGHLHWVLPGGAVEDGESVEEAAVREVREECGLEVNLERLLFIEQPGERGGVRIRQPRYTFLGRLVGGVLRVGADPGGGPLCGVAWMPFCSEQYDESTRATLDQVRAGVNLTRPD